MTLHVMNMEQYGTKKLIMRVVAIYTADSRLYEYPYSTGKAMRGKNMSTKHQAKQTTTTPTPIKPLGRNHKAECKLIN